ncbi:beta-lactamase family protein, partial [bacterium]|nr:beta-lactamase family protein [bacterium]
MKTLLVSLICLLSLSTWTSHANELESWKASIDEALTQNFKNDTQVGVVVGISYKGQKTYIFKGTSGNESQRQLSKDSVFEIGSVAKTMTALALANEVTRRKVSLETQIGTIWNELNGLDAGKITLLELTTHTSGLPRLPTNFAPKDWDDPYKDYDENLLLEYLKTYKRPEKKKETPDYSNVGVGLLGLVLAEKLNHMSVAQYLKKEVFLPINMESSSLNLSDLNSSFLSVGHNSFHEPVPYWNLAVMEAAGAVKSSTEDLLKYGEYFLNAKTEFDQKVIDLITTKRFPWGQELHIGLGWGIAEKGGFQILTHSGGTGGFTSVVFVDRTRDLVLVALSNTETLPACLFSKAVGASCEIPSYISLPAEKLVTFEGNYINKKAQMT